MKTNKLSHEILIIAVLTLTVCLVWVYLSVYKVFNKPDKRPILTPQEIKVINPKLDENVFEELEKRKP